jgi:preprotein translocase subunit YajC
MFIILASTFITFSFFYYMQQKRRIRNEQKIQNNKDMLDKLLGSLKRPKKDQNA